MSYRLIYGHLQQITFTAVSPDILNPTGNISGLFRPCGPSYLLYSSRLLTNPCLRGVKRRAGKSGSTVHAAPAVFSPLQKHCKVTRRTLEFLLNNRAKCSVPHLIDFPYGLVMGPSISLRQCTSNRVNVFRKGLTMPDHSDVSQAVAGQW